jgi:hypothetical protein
MTDKKLCHSLEALQNSSLRYFIWTATSTGNHGLGTNASNLGILLYDSVTQSKHPSRDSRGRRKLFIFIA